MAQSSTARGRGDKKEGIAKRTGVSRNVKQERRNPDWSHGQGDEHENEGWFVMPCKLPTSWRRHALDEKDWAARGAHASRVWALASRQSLTRAERPCHRCKSPEVEKSRRRFVHSSPKALGGTPNATRETRALPGPIDTRLTCGQSSGNAGARQGRATRQPNGRALRETLGIECLDTCALQGRHNPANCICGTLTGCISQITENPGLRAARSPWADEWHALGVRRIQGLFLGLSSYCHQRCQSQVCVWR